MQQGFSIRNLGTSGFPVQDMIIYLVSVVLVLGAAVNDNDCTDDHDDDYTGTDASHGVENNGRNPIGVLIGVGRGGRGGRRSGGKHGRALGLNIIKD